MRFPDSCAVRQDAGRVGEQRTAERAHAPVHRDVLVRHGVGEIEQGGLRPGHSLRGCHAVGERGSALERPAKVDRRGARLQQHAGDSVHVFEEASRVFGGIGPGAECESVRSSDPDGGRSADAHASDRVRDVVRRAANDPDRLTRKAGLIDQDGGLLLAVERDGAHEKQGFLSW